MRVGSSNDTDGACAAQLLQGDEFTHADGSAIGGANTLIRGLNGAQLEGQNPIDGFVIRVIDQPNVISALHPRRAGDTDDTACGQGLDHDIKHLCDKGTFVNFAFVAPENAGLFGDEWIYTLRSFLLGRSRAAFAKPV